ncbi:MAG TPA: NADH-quinone oxidoreductase subunit NuoN [Casimicrobiaceae bacterium]|nr:NADH-quinone oxidoreductase subunit NuoN [Casimicrobiaceae bacterium]
MKADLATALPEITLLCCACLVLVVDVFLPASRRHVSYWLTQGALLLTAWIVLTSVRANPVRGFHGMVVNDNMADLLKLAAIVAVSLMLFYGRRYFTVRGLFTGENFVLVLFSLLGMLIMIAAGSFITLYLGLELQSLALYALVASQRDRPGPAEAAMKYFVLGALASGMLLYGMSMLYGATGSLDLDRVAQATLTSSGDNHLLQLFGLVFVVSGIAFKLGAVPYHMWVPDVYEGAPTPITLLVGTAPKLAAFAFALRMLGGALKGLEYDWQGMLIVLSLLSMVLGNVIAIAQTDIKRMLAYSTIANMGYMLMGFLAADRNGFSAAMFYSVSYVLTSVASFGVVLMLSRAGFESSKIDDFKGLNQRSPWWAFMMLLVMFSLAGVPPTIGFYAKFSVIEAAINQGFVWLAVVAVMASLVGAFYYLRVVKAMYFDDPVETAPIDSRADARVLLSVNGLALLVLGILPQPLMGLCAIALTQSHF